MKQIKNYPNYWITEEGRIWSEKRQTWLIPEKVWNGYLRTTLYNEKGHKHLRIHRLVAETFLDNPDNLPEVHHKDHNRENNCVDNLEWIDGKRNRQMKRHTEQYWANKIWNALCDGGDNND